jgi:hypothetical protein
MLVKIEVYNDGESWCAEAFDGVFPPSEIDVLVVSELKLTYAPAATS